MQRFVEDTSPQAQRQYQAFVQQKQPKPKTLVNCWRAFWVGGTVCLFGELLTDIYERVLGISHVAAGTPAVVTLIFFGALLTGLGIYDDLANYAGAGLAVPVTGFANAVAASALEFKREGLVLGVGSKMFALAGSVITFGIVTAFFVGLIAAGLKGFLS